MSSNSLELDRITRTSLERLRHRLENRFSSQAEAQPLQWKRFIERLVANFPRLFGLYFKLYSDQYDFFYHLEDLVCILARMGLERPTDLKELDLAREADPSWFQSQSMIGGVCYVDLFAGDIKGLSQKIPYFKELGLTYLHLMPLFRVPQ